MHALRKILIELQESWRAFCFPLLCYGCGAVLEKAEEDQPLPNGLFCRWCRAGVRILDGVVCPCCGQPDVSVASKCRRCRGLFQGLRRAAAGAAYAGTVREIVLRFKFGRQRGMAYPLALLALLGARRALDARPVDCIVPVPLHPARRRHRGFNQAERMAEQMAALTGLPLMKGVVHRTRNTHPQGVGGGGSRRENVRGAFAPVRDNLVHVLQGEYPGKAVSNLHVLLVDDVLSTGTTLDECGRALLEAGADSVTGAAAAT